MLKTKTSRKLFTLALIAILVLSLSTSSFAYVKTNIGNNPQTLTAWNNSIAAKLKDNGTNNVAMTVATSGYSNWYVRQQGSGYAISNTLNNNYVNIYLVRQGGVYFNCTAYALPSGTNPGQDQIVDITSYPGDFSLIKLQNTSRINGGGLWYLMTDKSAPSTSSDVIWCQFSGGAPLRAQWY